MSEWEYTIRTVGFELVEDRTARGAGADYRMQLLDEKELASLGNNGWELVQVLSATKLLNFGAGVVPPFEYVCNFQYIFKRPKEKPASKPQLIRCPHCGQDQTNSRYCSICGQSIM